ncbi:hypothetical protein EC988_007475 [Linderina pennispora]|nr:hypothetical protein EC988_007475 [Linderina pennispora]
MGKGPLDLVCRLCQNADGITMVALPFVFRYLATELMSMNMKLKLDVKTQALRSANSTLRRRWLSSKPALEDIGVFRAYGRPVVTIFLWSTITYMSFQAVWSKLYFDEVRLETEAKIDALQGELAELQSRQE